MFGTREHLNPNASQRSRQLLATKQGSPYIEDRTGVGNPRIMAMSQENSVSPWPSSLEEDLKLGTVLADQYEITGMFGSGGFATVYKAIQLNIERPVAIKLIHQPKAGKPSSRERNLARFILEAKAAARIDHPNVVTVYDIGLIPPERPFIVMQPFNGHTLEDELHDHGPMTFARLQPLMVNVLDGLSIAHDQGIIHRDLKPDNLVLVYRGTRREMIKLIDFGIARLEWIAFRLTQTETRAGNPKYLAPEYIQDGTVTPAVDVYQMGLTLLEMLIGRPVVLGNAYQCTMQHLSGELNVPLALMQTPLGPVMQKALARNPEDRFADAGEFRDALEEIAPDSVVWQANTEATPVRSGASSLPEGLDPDTPILSSEDEIYNPVPMVEGPLEPNDSRASSARITVPEKAVEGPAPASTEDDSTEPDPNQTDPFLPTAEPASAAAVPENSTKKSKMTLMVVVAVVLSAVLIAVVGLVALSIFWSKGL